MKVSEMLTKKFLRKEDVGTGMLLTVTGLTQENVAKEGAEPEHKFCLTFEETDKPLVLNSTNMHLCVGIFGSEETDDWRGQRVVLYTDPTIAFGGKIVGGIRVRKPKGQAAAPALTNKAAVRVSQAWEQKLTGAGGGRPTVSLAESPAFDEVTDDDIPF